MPASEDRSTDAAVDAIEFYWRPGCFYCSRLERALEGAGVPLDKRNIWDDPAAAAYVRSVAGGNETVPTVVIGASSLVNPSPNDVLSTIHAEIPELADSLPEPAEPSSIGKKFQRLLGG